MKSITKNTMGQQHHLMNVYTQVTNNSGQNQARNRRKISITNIKSKKT